MFFFQNMATPLNIEVYLSVAQQLFWHYLFSPQKYFPKLTLIHCVTTEKVPVKYRSLKMADASLG